MINDMEYYINTVKTPNTVLAGGKLNCTVLVGGGGGTVFGEVGIFYYKNGGKHGGTVFGRHDIREASIGGFTKTGESMVLRY